MEYCVCGHLKEEHVGTSQGCYGCLKQYMKEQTSLVCSEFKLDNLKLIEDLAKEKNLI